MIEQIKELTQLFRGTLTLELESVDFDRVLIEAERETRKAGMVVITDGITTEDSKTEIIMYQGLTIKLKI